LKRAGGRDSHRNIFSKKHFLRIFTEILLDPAHTAVIIILAFSFFAPAFLFLLPSLRKKAGVYLQIPRKAGDISRIGELFVF
jgi:uncharacterized membrane protein